MRLGFVTHEELGFDLCRHGLRASERVGLRWGMLDFAQGYLHVRRLKNGPKGAPYFLE